LFVDYLNVDKRNVPRLQSSQNVLLPGKIDSEDILDPLIVDDFEGVVVNPQESCDGVLRNHVFRVHYTLWYDSLDDLIEGRFYHIVII